MIITPCCYPKQLHAALEEARTAGCITLNSSGDVTLTHVLCTLANEFEPLDITLATRTLAAETLHTLRTLMQRTIVINNRNVFAVNSLQLLLHRDDTPNLDELYRHLQTYGQRIRAAYSPHRIDLLAAESLQGNAVVLGALPQTATVGNSTALLIREAAAMHDALSWAQSDIRLHRVRGTFTY